MPAMMRRIAATSRPPKLGRVLLLLSGLGLSACSTPAPGRRVETPVLRGLADDTEVREYAIRGDSARELRAQMTLLGPKDWAGLRHDGQTEWTVSWFVKFDRGSDACSIESVIVTLDVIMNMPRWANAESGPNPLKKTWQDFLDALAWHENIHREYGVRAVAEIEKQLPALPAMDSCEKMQSVANATGSAVVKKFQKESFAYDVKTRHGALQGLRFP